jgi:hypothetical protein
MLSVHDRGCRIVDDVRLPVFYRFYRPRCRVAPRALGMPEIETAMSHNLQPPRGGEMGCTDTSSSKPLATSESAKLLPTVLRPRSTKSC